MGVYAIYREGDKERVAKAQVYHWWPGRTWEGPCPIRDEARLFELGKKRYGTVVRFNIRCGNTGTLRVGASCSCSKKDSPSRKSGRALATSRAVSLLKGLVDCEVIEED